MRRYLEQITHEELEYCRENIFYFIEEYCRIEDKDRPGLVIPFRLWEGQKEAVRSILSHRFNIILKARQLGMSWLTLAIALHTLMFHEGSTVAALSRTQNEARELVRRIRAMCAEMREFISQKRGDKPYYMESTQMSLTLYPKEGRESVFQAFTGSPAAARSFTANLIIFDEWAYQQNAEEIWISGLPTVNRPNGGKVIG
ncbi:MAG: terminase family protein, partial [Christensenellaceae bacterium]|nr:terminase family protein [Christensenellaceae bacterium]